MVDRVPRPRPEARAAFELLTDLIERGKSLAATELVDRINKILAVSHPGSEKVSRWGWFFKEDRAREIWEGLYKGFDELRAGKPFKLPTNLLSLFEPGTDGVVWDRTHGLVMRLPSTEPTVLVFRRVFDLLTEVAPRLRVCAREDCERFFLFERPKQVYCSERCAQRERMARFLAGQSHGPSKRRAARAG